MILTELEKFLESWCRICEYYVIRSQAVTGRCICPKCGYEDTIENLVDGFDYCHTKFHIQDFGGKVLSVKRRILRVLWRQDGHVPI